LHLWSYRTEFFLQLEIFQTKFVEKIKTHIIHAITFFPKIMPFMRLCGKIFHIWARVLHAGPLRLQTHTRNVNFSLRIENCYDTFFNSEEQILKFLSLFFRFVIIFFNILSRLLCYEQSFSCSFLCTLYTEDPEIQYMAITLMRTWLYHILYSYRVSTCHL
jgi:hypothetical protein